MHPNVFLKNFWRMERRPQVFVAMSFAPQYEPRFRQVIEPAIQSIQIATQPLKAHRVDLSKSGDSILTEIMDGIAHSALILADVSVVERDEKTGAGHRNGNVMYEVGLALACRQPAEVLLVRDDDDPFLFDVSTIPHKRLDFSEPLLARRELAALLKDRWKEARFVADARIANAVTALSADELAVIAMFGKLPPGQVFGFRDTGSVNFLAAAALPRLLDKGVIELTGKFEGGGPAYRWTELGVRVVVEADSRLRLVGKPVAVNEPPATNPDADQRIHE